jgi:hypothetical protein
MIRAVLPDCNRTQCPPSLVSVVESSSVSDHQYLTLSLTRDGVVTVIRSRVVLNAVVTPAETPGLVSCTRK